MYIALIYVLQCLLNNKPPLYIAREFYPKYNSKKGKNHSFCVQKSSTQAQVRTTEFYLRL